MSAARKVFKVFLAILLTLALIVFTISLCLFQFTSHKNLSPVSSSVIEQEISNVYSELTPDEITDARNDIIEKCLGKQEAVISLTTAKAENDFLNETKINCSGINNETSTEFMIKAVSEGVINSLYYKEYNCEFESCIQEQGIITLASQKSNNYFKGLMIMSGILVILLLIGVILLSKPKYTVFNALAPAFMITGLLFLTSFLIKSVLQQELIGMITSSLASIILVNFLIVFILGFIFLILAIVFKIKKKKK